MDRGNPLYWLLVIVVVLIVVVILFRFLLPAIFGGDADMDGALAVLGLLRS